MNKIKRLELNDQGRIVRIAGTCKASDFQKSITWQEAIKQHLKEDLK